MTKTKNNAYFLNYIFLRIFIFITNLFLAYGLIPFVYKSSYSLINILIYFVFSGIMSIFIGKIVSVVDIKYNNFTTRLINYFVTVWVNGLVVFIFLLLNLDRSQLFIKYFFLPLLIYSIYFFVFLPVLNVLVRDRKV